MKPTDEQFAQINAIEQECFHGSWTSDTLLSELNSPLNILVTEAELSRGSRWEGSRQMKRSCSR